MGNTWMIYLLTFSGLNFLVGCAEIVARGADILAGNLGVLMMLIGMIVVAAGISAPELVVTVNATLAGSPELAVGNLVGSNIANSLLILCVACILMPIVEKRAAFKRDGFMLLGGTMLFIVLSLRSDLSGLAGGADLLVRGCTNIARNLEFSEEVISLTLFTVGTSLPELAASVIAALKDYADIGVGNNLFDLLGVGGIAASIDRIPVLDQLIGFDIWVMLTAALVLMPVLVFGWRNLRATVVCFWLSTSPISGSKSMVSVVSSMFPVKRSSNDKTH